MLLLRLVRHGPKGFERTFEISSYDKKRIDDVTWLKYIEGAGIDAGIEGNVVIGDEVAEGGEPRPHGTWHAAYVMNSDGNTIDTIS